MDFFYVFADKPEDKNTGGNKREVARYVVVIMLEGNSNRYGNECNYPKEHKAFAMEIPTGVTFSKSFNFFIPDV